MPCEYGSYQIIILTILNYSAEKTNIIGNRWISSLWHYKHGSVLLSVGDKATAAQYAITYSAGYLNDIPTIKKGDKKSPLLFLLLIRYFKGVTFCHPFFNTYSYVMSQDSNKLMQNKNCGTPNIKRDKSVAVRKFFVRWIDLRKKFESSRKISRLELLFMAHTLAPPEEI